MNRTEGLFRLFAGLIIFSVCGSAASRLFGVEPGFIAPLAGALVILTGATCIARQITSGTKILTVLILGLVSELIGLYTGFPFGRYEYTNQWWPTVQIPDGRLFPLLLPLSWLMIAGGSALVAHRFVKKSYAPLVAGGIAALIDLPMERVMTDVFGYWRWAEEGLLFGAPLANFVGWFLVSALAAAVVGPIRSKSPVPARVLALFCIFVGTCGLIRYFDWAFLLLVGEALLLTVVAVPPKQSVARNM